MTETVTAYGTDWQLIESHHSPFVRYIDAIPTTPPIVVYATETYVKGRPADATFEAAVVKVALRHQWDEGKGWWSSGGLHLHLVNPKNGKRYKTGWKAQMIYPGWANDGVEDSYNIISPLLEATLPRTVISVEEVPA